MPNSKKKKKEKPHTYLEDKISLKDVLQIENPIVQRQKKIVSCFEGSRFQNLKTNRWTNKNHAFNL
jgi:hypothetical protein